MCPPKVARLSDFGSNDTIYNAKTHLGRILKPGDNAWGYDMANLNICDPEMLKHLDTKAGAHVPEVIFYAWPSSRNSALGLLLVYV